MNVLESQTARSGWDDSGEVYKMWLLEQHWFAKGCNGGGITSNKIDELGIQLSSFACCSAVSIQGSGSRTVFL